MDICSGDYWKPSKNSDDSKETDEKDSSKDEEDPKGEPEAESESEPEPSGGEGGDSVIYSGCGQTKTCFGFPQDCVTQNKCSLLASWRK